MKLIFPDPLYQLDQIPSSLFLYFQQEISFTLPPVPTMHLSGTDPFRFAQLLHAGNYKCSAQIQFLISSWFQSSQNFAENAALMKPLHDQGYVKGVILAYSRTEQEYLKMKEMLDATGFSKQELLSMIELPLAIQELTTHIVYEKFLEFNPNADRENRENNSYTELMEYTEQLFRTKSMEELLISSYFLRIRALKHFPDILLTNPRLIEFFRRLPVEYAGENDATYYEQLDVVSWEIFRQLTSSYIDALPGKERVARAVEIRTGHADEVNNLKNKCLQLAEQFKGETNAKLLEQNIAQHIRVHTEKDIADLLQINAARLNDVMSDVFSDEKTWLALTTFFISLFTGTALITGGAGLVAFANLGSKVFKNVAQTEKTINSSQYALIYRLNKLKK